MWEKHQIYSHVSGIWLATIVKIPSVIRNSKFIVNFPLSEAINFSIALNSKKTVKLQFHEIEAFRTHFFAFRIYSIHEKMLVLSKYNHIKPHKLKRTTTGCLFTHVKKSKDKKKIDGEIYEEQASSTKGILCVVSLLFNVDCRFTFIHFSRHKN